jgi:CheY-like chemotaxis protein
MRPLKSILIVDTNDERISLLRFLLYTWHFRVEIARSVEEVASLCMFFPNLVILRAPCPGIDLNAAIDAARAPGLLVIPTLLITKGTVNVSEIHAGSVISERDPVAGLIDRVNTLTAGKRGPKKGWKRKPVATDTAVDIASRRIA